MKKTIKRNWLNALIISVSLLLINCSVEEEVISGSHFGPQNKKFTYSDFLKETKVKDFDIFAKYNVSRSENSVLQRSIETDFITDTTEIKRLEIPNTEKTTYSFKLYPLSEQLNSKEYYNMVVEKNANQLTYMVFFNKDKQNPAPTELKTQTSQMVFNSRRPHSGYSEVITYHFHCTQTGRCASGVCDQCSLCVSETVSYLYIGQDNGSNSGGSFSGGTGTGSSNGGGGPLDGFYIPNPYDGIDMNDPSNLALALSFQINTFFNTLSPELKEIAKKYVNFAFAFQYFNIHELNDTTKQHYLTALTNYKNFIDATANTQINTDAQARLEYWAFQTFLNNNENGINNSKINNIKNFVNNPNVDFLTKEKIIDELATKNNQEVLDFVNELINYCISQGDTQESIDEINNILDIINDGQVNGEQVVVGPDTPITNMADYLSCFNTSQSATITIYADQPKSGKHDLFSVSNSVGHAFISIKQGNNIATLGFYPQSSVGSIIPNNLTPDPTDFFSTPGVFGNDQGHTYDVSLTVPINSSGLTNLINGFISIAENNPVYNLGSLNCTDIALMAFESNTNVNIPSCESPFSFWNGQTPGTLGEVIRNMPTPTGGIKNTNGGNAPNNNCN